MPPPLKKNYFLAWLDEAFSPLPHVKLVEVTSAQNAIMDKSNHEIKWLLGQLVEKPLEAKTKSLEPRTDCELKAQRI